MNKNKMREDAKPYVGHYVNDALSTEPFEIDDNVMLIGWQCGFEPMFVAVKSYLDGIKVPVDEAVEIATDLLVELNWFDDGDVRDPSHIL